MPEKTSDPGFRDVIDAIPPLKRRFEEVTKDEEEDKNPMCRCLAPRTNRCPGLSVMALP